MMAFTGGKLGIGTANPQGTLDVAGAVKIHGQRPIIIRRYINLGDNINFNTGYASSTYNAAIAGFRALHVDIQENDTGDFMQLYMNVVNGIWHIMGDLRSHNDHENWHVDVMYIRTELSERLDF